MTTLMWPKAACGHNQNVIVPKFKESPGWEGRRRLAEAEAAPCARCRDRMIRQDRCAAPGVRSHQMVFIEARGLAVCSLCQAVREDILARVERRYRECHHDTPLVLTVFRTQEQLECLGCGFLHMRDSEAVRWPC